MLYPKTMNVRDELKDLTQEQIKHYCQNNACKASVAMFNVDYDFNISALIRGANFLGFKEVFHIQKEGKRLDRRGAVGTQHYTELKHFYTEQEFFTYIAGKYVPYAVENNTDYKDKEKVLWDHVPVENACYIFGAENKGLDNSVLDQCKKLLYIPSYGCVPSLNVGVASGMVMSHHRSYFRG